MVTGYSGFGNLVCGLKSSFNSGVLVVCIFTMGYYQSIWRRYDYSLNVPMYVEKYDLGEIEESMQELIRQWNESSSDVKKHTTELFSTLKEVI